MSFIGIASNFRRKPKDEKVYWENAFGKPMTFFHLKRG